MLNRWPQTKKVLPLEPNESKMNLFKVVLEEFDDVIHSDSLSRKSGYINRPILGTNT